MHRHIFAYFFLTSGVSISISTGWEGSTGSGGSIGPRGSASSDQHATHTHAQSAIWTHNFQHFSSVQDHSEFEMTLDLSLDTQLSPPYSFTSNQMKYLEVFYSKHCFFYFIYPSLTFHFLPVILIFLTVLILLFFILWLLSIHCNHRCCWGHHVKVITTVSLPLLLLRWLEVFTGFDSSGCSGCGRRGVPCCSFCRGTCFGFDLPLKLLLFLCDTIAWMDREMFDIFV